MVRQKQTSEGIEMKGLKLAAKEINGVVYNSQGQLV